MKGTAMQTSEAALVELNEEDLLAVSGGQVTVSAGGPGAAAVGLGTGATATANRITGTASATSNFLAGSFTWTGALTIGPF